MNNRVVIKELEPKAYEAMFGLEKYLSKTNLDASLKELIKIRVSQINGCAYCIDLHTREARSMGETEQRIYALSAWRETSWFTQKERVVLALAEEITFISKGVSDKTYSAAAELFDDHTLAQAIMAIVTINAWNRIAIATHMRPAQH
ncbi:alkylhydroperoxidase AhpD family core domain-containing protein [Dyadobacter koreensis]|uniref:Alkylhydroperoxidase AhpD family core domain-containing protein n=1 Tax=Dyadobacter koreensis TaxID=408657 RepID=A0A1H6XVY6_9BACT|nr:carboxymuconolactone decarboxylase family protein [Dyadobacter koreensis]SEJ28705.1 alkylhydroperoxidase AhpD family core domain-containing protein [Dyadobacter koreensis]